MASGKTTIGNILAGRLDYEFMDLDTMIENEEGMMISEIFNSIGEEEFRIIENKRLKQLHQVATRSRIIALGGGTPCFFDNMDFINNNGQSFYLKLTASELLLRLEHNKDNRPLLQNLTSDGMLRYIKEKLAERSAFYEKADYIIEANRKKMDVIRSIEDAVIK